MPSPSSGESESDFVSRCIPIVIKDGSAKDTKQAAAMCHSMFGQKKNSKFQLITNHMKLSINKDERREEGDFVVYPTVASKEGVMNFALKPSEEVEAFANGISKYGLRMPITVQHPDNEFGFVVSFDEISGNFGGNTEFNAETTQVTTEMRIHKDFPDVIEKIDNGTYPDVSIGYFARIEELDEEGVYHDALFSGEDKRYKEIEHKIFPNHMAVLGANEGACSKKDGCGIMLNQTFEPPESGDLPSAGKKILSSTYSSCRSQWVKGHPDDKENSANKTSCSRIAWSAVKKAGYTKDGDHWTKNEINSYKIDSTWINTGTSTGENITFTVDTDLRGEDIMVEEEEILENADPSMEAAKVTTTHKTCKNCGTTWFSGDIACPACGTKDYWDYETNVPDTESHGMADDMIWTPSEVKPPKPHGEITNEQEVNELTEDEEPQDNTEELEKLRAENEEMKAKLEAHDQSDAEREEAELNSLRAEVNKMQENEDEDKKIDVSEMTKPALEALISWNTNHPVPEAKLNSMRGKPDIGETEDSEKVELLKKIRENNKHAIGYKDKE